MNIGDKVRYVGTDPDLNGEIGVIIEIWSTTHGPKYEIRFNNPDLYADYSLEKLT